MGRSTLLPGGGIPLPPAHDTASIIQRFPESTATTPSPAEHFRFLDLPKDIRRMVYDYLPTLVFRPVSESFYHDLQPPVNLLLTSRFLYDEVKACVHEHRIQYPVVMFSNYDVCDIVNKAVLDANEVGWYPLLLSQSNFDPSDERVWKRCKDVVLDRTTSDNKRKPDNSEKSIAAIQAFAAIATPRLLRNPKIQVRILYIEMDARVIVFNSNVPHLVKFLNFTSNLNVFPEIDVVFVTENEEDEKALISSIGHTGGGEGGTVVGWSFEQATEEEREWRSRQRHVSAENAASE